MLPLPQYFPSVPQTDQNERNRLKLIQLSESYSLSSILLPDIREGDIHLTARPSRSPERPVDGLHGREMCSSIIFAFGGRREISNQNWASPQIAEKRNGPAFNVCHRHGPGFLGTSSIDYDFVSSTIEIESY
jgi:hypothetical protein